MASPSGFLSLRLREATARLFRSSETSSPAPEAGIGVLPVEILECVIATALSSEALGVFLALSADSTAYSQMRSAIRRRSGTASRLVLVNRTWQALVVREMSRLIYYRPSSIKESEVDIAEELEEDAERANRIEEVIVDLEDVPRQSVLGTHSMGSSQPLLDMQRSSAEVCLCCPQASRISVFRRTARQRVYHALDPFALPAALDQNLVDAIITRPRLTALDLHPASSYLDIQTILMCPPTLSSLSVTLSHDLRAQPSVSGAATPPSPTYSLRHLTVIFLADGCVRSADLLKLLGRSPTSLQTLEVRFDAPREDSHHLFSEWARLLDMLLSRCSSVTRLMIAGIGVGTSPRLASALGQCQDALHALTTLEALTLSRVFFPDVFILTCDTLLSQLDVPMHTDYRASSPPRSMWSDPLQSPSTTSKGWPSDDLFGLLDADGGQGTALRATIERIGTVPKVVRFDDGGTWSSQQRRVIQDRCSRLGIAMISSWHIGGGSPKMRGRSLSS